MNLAPIGIVAAKELKDGFRDRRAILTILLSALIGPLMISFMLKQFAGQKKAAEEIRLPVAGRELAPVLVNWLEQQSGVEIVAAPADPEDAVRDSREDIVLAIKKEFAERFAASRPAPVQLISDSTRVAAQPKIQRVKELLARFSSETGGLRLITRGVSPMVASALEVKEIEASSASQRAAQLLNMIPMFMMIAVFAAAMQIATDSTAGERERASLEPLLLNPVPRWQMVCGKWLAAAAAGLIGMVGTLAVLFQLLSKLSLEDLGVRFHPDLTLMILLSLVAAPMAFLAPAMEIYLASFSKSFKESQSYMAFVILGAAAPGILSTFYPIVHKPWMQLMPVLGQYALANLVLSGKVPSAVTMAGAALSDLALAAVFLALATRLFSSEKIIFNR